MVARIPRPNIDPVVFLVMAIVLMIVLITTKASAQITGFTEAYRTVEVASPESGVLTELFVKPGDYIEQRSPIAKLDSEVQQTHLKLAEFMANAQSELMRAEAEMKTKQSVVQHLEELESKGFAQQKELMRARLELQIAQSGLLARKEKIAENQLRLDIAKLNLNRRTLFSPVSGVVAEIQRNPGEFVSPANPHVVTIMQIDPMIARFQINVRDIDRLALDQNVTITLENNQKVSGKVDSIGVVAESENGHDSNRSRTIGRFKKQVSKRPTVLSSNAEKIKFGIGTQLIDFVHF